MTALNPERDKAQRGSAEECAKLRAALERYYRDNHQWFDHAQFAQDFDLFQTLLKAD